MLDRLAYTRKLIEANTVSYYRRAEGTRPDLREVRIGDRTIVVKDFKRSDPLFRLIVGPILIRREYGALRRLLGVKGVPQLIGKIDRYALAVEHIAGLSIDELERSMTSKLEDYSDSPSSTVGHFESITGKLNADFYENLRRVVDEMHSRGVAHCDLRSRGNVVIGDDGLPYIVDFAACVLRGRGINPFFKWLFQQFVLADRNAILLLKRRLSPELLTDAEKAELATPLPFEKPAKRFGEAVRRITRKLLTRRKKQDTTN